MTQQQQDSLTFLKDASRQLAEAIEKGAPVGDLYGLIAYVQRCIASYMEVTK